MKKLVFLLTILLGSLNACAKESVVILVTPKDVFYFQIGKLMKGGQLEIYDPTGNLITSQAILSRKLTVELPDLSPGEYVLKIVKRSKEQSFKYLGGNHGQAKVAMCDEINISLKLETNGY